MPQATSLQRIAGVLAILAALATPAVAQRYHVHTYTEGDGLPSSTARGMTQDLAGRMWFATRAGIAVYDGRDWTKFSPAEGLMAADWYELAVDDRGRVWAVSRRFDLAVYDGGRWRGLPNPNLEQTCELRDMTVASGQGPERVVVGSSCGVVIWEHDAWRRLGIEHGLGHAQVTATEFIDEDLYVATYQGVSVLDGVTGDAFRPASFRSPPGAVLGLARSPAGPQQRLWTIGEDWIGCVDQGEFELLAEGLAIAAGPGERYSAADGNDGLFFGSELALYYFHPDRGLQLLDERHGLVAGGARDILRDREGNVWVSTTRGVSKVVSFRFATMGEEHGLYEDEVTSVLERRSGGFVLGHRSGLTFLDDAATLLPTRTVHLPESERLYPGLGRVLQMDEDSAGVIWIAGNRLGLGRLERGRQPVWFQAPQEVMAVLVDHGGRIWLAAGAEIYTYEDGQFQLSLAPPGERVPARRLIEGPDGAIYALTGGRGVHRLLDGQWTTWVHVDRSNFNNVFSFLPRADGDHWVGTVAGLAVIRDGQLEPAKPPLPAIERPIYFMLTDAHDQVWFGTDNGVLRWDGTTLDPFTVEDGLGGRETNRDAGLIDSQGRLWIGTTHGLSIYREELDRRVPVPPMVSLVGLEVAGDSLPLDDTVRLAPNSNDLVFHFRAISFYNEDAVQLQTWLEGYEAGWSDDYMLADRRLRYTHLPPGTYRQHIRARSSAGSWSEPVSSPPVVIAPPFWRQSWFWALSLVLLVLLLYAAQRFVGQRRYARRLEIEVRERVAELRRAEAELTRAQRLEALGLLAGGIAHDFNNLLMVILGNLSLVRRKSTEQVHKWIADAEAAIERARQLTAQLLAFSRGGTPVRSAARIGDVVRESASFVLSGSRVRCDIDLADDLALVSIDTGQISQVINNLLINAMQAMPEGGAVKIHGRNVDRMPDSRVGGPGVAIAVEDHGIGIPRHNVDRIFDPYFSTKEEGSGLGLTTAYAIATRHRGALTVESETGVGSRFTLYLPVSDQQPPESEPAAPAREDYEGAHILVMDDDRAVRDVIEAMLRGLGCTVVTAASGEDALRAYVQARAEGRAFDALILDLTVPGGMGGEEVLQHLLQIDPEVRAIVASGYANAPVMSDFRERGFQAALRKPFRQQAIGEVLRRVLGVRVGS